MSSNGSGKQTDSDSGSGQSSDDVANLIIAVVALIISVIAFVIATLQALQQYYGTATGYSSCTEEIMGKWAAFTHRRMKWSEFRFQVEFEVPVIFVARPENQKGPLGSHDQKAIVFMDGSPRSLEESHTRSQKEFNQRRTQRILAGTRQGVHTADNEEASWLALLMAIQRMEGESRGWQQTQTGYSSPVAHNPPHSIIACLQSKKKSWDSMPPNLTKPYAYTTIAHLVEIAAMLGIYWKDFNLNEDRYRARGNGFSIIGSYVEGLGIAFTFQKVGPTWFEENRVVPNYRIKELCFGFCPTIFRGEHDVLYADEPKDRGTLQLGSLAEIAETLVVFGCNNKTVNFFRKHDEKARYSHLFPVPFEILGMVGIVLQVENTAFRALPNPTVFTWDTESFSLHALMLEYASALQERQRSGDKLLKDNPEIAKILLAADNIENAFSDWQLGLPMAGAAKDAVVTPDVYPPALLAALRAAIRGCDEYLKQPDRLRLVQQVLRVHVQEVLDTLNPDDDEDDADDGRGGSVAYGREVHHLGDAADAGDFREQYKGSKAVLQSLDSASSGERHRLAAKLYVSFLRRRVVQVVCGELDMGRKRERRLSLVSTDTISGAAVGKQVNDTWCMLVFRMMCWLLLHDFHKKDIHVSKSDVFESRMPVYVT